MNKSKKATAKFLMISLMASLLTACSGSSSNQTAAATTAGQESSAQAPATTAAEAPETSWPEKPVTIIVPFAAGGDSDFNARALAEKLTERTGQSFIVQNVNGNSGATGSLQALSADPDGYTILFNHTAFSINYFSKNSTLTYDDVTLGAVCGFLDATLLVGRPDLGITKLSQVVEYSHEHPGEFLYGSAAGTTVLVSGLQLKAAGADITIVDTGGAADRMAAILGGHVDMVAVPVGNAKDYLETGELVEIENDLDEVIGCPVYYQMMFPKGVDETIVAKLDTLLEDIILHDDSYAESIMNAYQQKPFYKDAVEGKEFVQNLWDELAALKWD